MSINAKFREFDHELIADVGNINGIWKISGSEIRQCLLLRNLM